MECSSGGSVKSCEMYKEALCAQKGCLRLFIFLLVITGSTQQVNLQPFNTANTICHDGGVVDGINQVEMFGSVFADGTSPIVIDLYWIRDGDTVFIPACTINVDRDGCVSQSAAICYCQGQSANTYTVVYNKTADVQDSKSTLVLSYGVDSSQTLPVVYGAERVSVKIGGSGPNILLSDICSQQFNTGKTYDFEICGENLVNAKFYIGMDEIGGQWEDASNDCSLFKVTAGLTTLTFAYNETVGCLRSGSKSCNVTETGESGEDCDTTCIIIIVVVVVVVCGAGIAVGAIYYWKKHGKITTCVIKIKVSATLIELKTMVIRAVESQGHNPPDCEIVFKYEGEKQDDNNTKLEELVLKHEGDTLKVTVNVYRNGTCVLEEIVSEGSSVVSNSKKNNAVSDSPL